MIDVTSTSTESNYSIDSETHLEGFSNDWKEKASIAALATTIVTLAVAIFAAPAVGLVGSVLAGLTLFVFSQEKISSDQQKADDLTQEIAKQTEIFRADRKALENKMNEIQSEKLVLQETARTLENRLRTLQGENSSDQNEKEPSIQELNNLKEQIEIVKQQLVDLHKRAAIASGNEEF